jgi:serine/threonine protein kinase
MWSMGCILYELITGELLFPAPIKSGDSEDQQRIAQIECIFSRCGWPESEWPEMSRLPDYQNWCNRADEFKGDLDVFLSERLPPQFQDAKRLLLGLLEMSPKKRLSAKQAFLHEFLRSEDGSLEPENLPKLNIPEIHEKDKEMRNWKEKASKK